MKKLISLISSIAVCLSLNCFNVMAKDTPVNIDSDLYDRLIGMSWLDLNEDGILSEEEYHKIKSLELDLTGMSSIDFIYDLPNLEYLYLTDGDISDFTFLKDFKKLKTLQLRNMPQVKDVSFIKDMELELCYLINMDHITDEERLSLLKYTDAENGAVGFANNIGATPNGLFRYSDVLLEIENDDIAEFYQYTQRPVTSLNGQIYGKSCGETRYTLKFKDKVIHEGIIKIGSVNESNTPTKTDETNVSIYTSNFINPYQSLVLKDNKLCKLQNGAFAVMRDNVRDFTTGSYYSDKSSVTLTIMDTVLYEDGTIEINGQTTVGTENITFSKIQDEYAVSSDGGLYCFYGENGRIIAERVFEGFGGFFDERSLYVLSDEGEVILIEFKKSEDKATSRQAFPTGIKNVISHHNDYFVDGDNILWEVIRSVGSEPRLIRKIADNVEWVGYRDYANRTVYGCVYITTDGSAYTVNTKAKVTLDEDIEKPYLTYGAYTDAHALVGINNMATDKYFIDKDNRLCMEYNGIRKVTNDVKKYLTAEFDEETGLPDVYYLKFDNTIWRYSFSKDSFSIVTNFETVKTIKGDINNDGIFSIADVVMLQKWLLNEPNVSVLDWKAADFNNDSKLDVFDLSLMRKELIKN